MLTKVWSVANKGLKAIEVEVEVNVAEKGFPSFNIVGLPSTAVKEARERVRTALINSGLNFPDKKITVNLAPADLPKEGSCYDLPIAVGILIACGELELPNEKIYFYGEVGLDGKLRHTRGVFLVAMLARENKVKKTFVSKLSANEASVVDKVKTYPVSSLIDLIMHFRGGKKIKPLNLVDKVETLRDIEVEFDFSQVLGQEQAKRALMIAAGGGHNVFMVGPPGSGKTMLAKALPGILPYLTEKEALEVTKIYSVTGRIEPGGGLIRRRPFRSPHHTTSKVGLIGGGSDPMPGEISLAHRGVLFMDEFAEYTRSSLEALRQPLEDGNVTVVRAAGTVKFPAKFMLVAAANPCPCGFLNHPKKECKCSPYEIRKYRKKLSGPMMDRIDIHVNVPFVDADKLKIKDSESDGLSSKEIRKKIEKARLIQRNRFEKENIFTNAEMRNKQIKKYCELSKEAERLLKMAVDKYQLSARGYFRLIKVSQTIVDLAGDNGIDYSHMAEALQYRIRGE